MSKILTVIGKEGEFVLNCTLKFVLAVNMNMDKSYIMILSEKEEIRIPKDKIIICRITQDTSNYSKDDTEFKLHVSSDGKLPDYIKIIKRIKMPKSDSDLSDLKSIISELTSKDLKFIESAFGKKQIDN